MQMSRYGVFVFVEGSLDRHVYGRIAEETLAPDTYQLASSSEIPENIGSGKPALLELFRFLRRDYSLRTELGGKRTSVLFFLDKDVDDVRRRKCRSEHVVYSEHYELENDLFIVGDLVAAVATAGRLDRAWASAVLAPSPDLWRAAAAAHWENWVALCVFAMLLPSAGPATYQRASPIHVSPRGPRNAMAEARLLVQVRFANRAMSGERFFNLLDLARSQVRRRYRSGRVDGVFRGKWYLQFLRDSISSFPTAVRVDLTGFDDRVLAVLAYTALSVAGWQLRYTDALMREATWAAA